MMNGYLCKSGEKTVYNWKSAITKFATAVLQNFSPERQRINHNVHVKDILEKFVTIAKVIKNMDASKYRAFKLKQ